MREEGLEARALGATGIKVSALGMGCGRIGSDPRPGSLRDARDAISLALASGITFFDTADAYGRGLSEVLIGRALARWPGDVIVATKCGMLKTPGAFLRAASSHLTGAHGEPVRRLRDLPQHLRSRRSYEPDYVARAARSSLRRLRREHIDLFLLHSPPIDVLERGDIVMALEALKTSGKVRFWGMSVRSAEDASYALALPGISAIEIPLNLCETAALHRAIPEARRRGVGVIARQPFASGGVLGAWRKRLERSSDGPADASLLQREVFDACIQFVLRTEGVSTVIAGMTKPEHVAANIDSALSNRVSPEEISSIREALCG